MNFKCKCENCKAEQEVNPVEVKTDEKRIKLLSELKSKLKELEEKEESFTKDYESCLSEIKVPLHIKLASLFSYGGFSTLEERYRKDKLEEKYPNMEQPSRIKTRLENEIEIYSINKKYWLCKLCKFRNNIGFDEKERI